MDPRMMALQQAMGGMPDEAAAPEAAPQDPGAAMGKEAAVAQALAALEPFIEDAVIAQAAQLLQDSLAAGPESEGLEDSAMMQEEMPPA